MSGRTVAVIGGGINGAAIAWELARRDYDVTLFERDEFGGATSSASTKLIHGGLRYLEHGRFGLVRESLAERQFLLANVPDLVKPLELILPLYAEDGRSRIRVGVGLSLYDFLARSNSLPRHELLSPEAALQRVPLRAKGLKGAFSFWDGQADDRALVERVIESARADGVNAVAHAAVESIRQSRAGVTLKLTSGAVHHAEAVVNAAGPWASELLRRNGIQSRYSLTLVRGSHLVIQGALHHAGALLQSPIDRRIIFVLPWKGKTLVGTTEVEQTSIGTRVEASDEEIDYLIRQYNAAFEQPIERRDVIDVFSGVRPLVRGGANITSLSRESKVETIDRLVNVFGGKLTTFMALAREVGNSIDKIFGARREAREAKFVGGGNKRE